MMNSTPSGVKIHCESTKQKCQTAKMFSFFFLPLLLLFLLLHSDRLVQNCVTLSRWFLNKTAAFYQYTEQCISPCITFSQLSSLMKCFKPVTEKLELWSFATQFSSLACTQNHLAMKHNYYSELEIWLVCMETGSLCHPLLTRCLNSAWQGHIGFGRERACNFP